MLVGLCGGSGAGKGYVAELFLERGIPSIDTDAVYRNLTAPASEPSECMKALCCHFGNIVLSEDNSLNRAEMRRLVFGEENKENLKALNRISHKFILEKTLSLAEEYENNGFGIVLIDAPVLYESGFDKLCEKVICVTADEKVRIRRIVRRDKITEEAAKERIISQTSAKEAEEKADYVIENNGNDAEMIPKIDDCVADLKKLYNSKESI